MSLSVSGYMNQFYKGNLFGATKNGRTGQSSNSLAVADMKAVRKAVKQLGEYDFEEGDGEELVNKVQAFVSTYNNYIDSAKAVGDADADRYLKQLKKMTKEFGGELDDIGISVQNSGKLAVDKKTLQSTGRYQVSRLFGSDAEFSVQIENQMKRTNSMFKRNRLDVPKQMNRPAAKPSDKPSESAPADGGDESGSGTAADDNTQLARQLAEVLSGSMVNYTV